MMADAHTKEKELTALGPETASYNKAAPFISAVVDAVAVQAAASSFDYRTDVRGGRAHG